MMKAITVLIVSKYPLKRKFNNNNNRKIGVVARIIPWIWLIYSSLRLLIIVLLIIRIEVLARLSNKAVELYRLRFKI